MANQVFPQGFPQALVPWMDQTGRPTRDFLYLIQALWNRTGGASGVVGGSGDLSPSLAALLMGDTGGDSDPLTIPGPQGVAGPQGMPGVPMMLDGPGSEDSFPIPGPAGPAGAPGPAGPAVYLEAPEADEPLVMPPQLGALTYLPILGAIAPAAPTTVSGSTYAMAQGDFSLIFNPTATCTLTLLSAAAWKGRLLLLMSTAAFAVNSASSNVTPLGSATPGTAILAATVGKFALMQSDGANWRILMAN